MAKKIEICVSRAAAGALGGACGFSIYTLLAHMGAQPSRTAMALGAAALAYLGGERMLASVGVGGRRHKVPVFDVGSIEPMGPDELILTDADRFPARTFAQGGPLELDDVLAEIGPDSRVVRLFDPAAIPTPGQLKARIDRHLGQDSPGSARPDESQALYEALNALRRSMR